MVPRRRPRRARPRTTPRGASARPKTTWASIFVASRSPRSTRPTSPSSSRIRARSAATTTTSSASPSRRTGGTLEERIARLEHDLREYQRLLDVLMRALLDKGVLTKADIERQRAFLAGRGAFNGARIVARAWVDPAFKQALLTRGREAVRELNIPPGRLGKLGVADNTATLHHVVVGTLRSCYPHDLLGDPPRWYLHDSLKQSVVRDPRGTLAHLFHLRLPPRV